MEEEKRSNVLKLRSINQVCSQKPCALPVTYIQDYMAIHDFDRDMVDVSIGLTQGLMVDRLIGKTRVSVTKKVYATIYKLKLPLSNTGSVVYEVGNRF